VLEVERVEGAVNNARPHCMHAYARQRRQPFIKIYREDDEGDPGPTPLPPCGSRASANARVVPAGFRLQLPSILAHHETRTERRPTLGSPLAKVGLQ
jgi:hypothetical protein